MFAPYRTILQAPGALGFTAAAFLARTPISMVTLGVVLLVQSATGSYGLAGAVSATGALAGGVGAAAQGRLADLIGQRWVLPAAAVVFSIGLATLVASVQSGHIVPGAFVGAVLTGVAMPQAGAMVRARWRMVVPRYQLQTAFAFEAVLDEVIFILGPVIVVALATAFHPAAALAVPAVTGVLGALALAAQRGSEPPVRPRRRRDSPEPAVREGLGWAGLAPVVLAFIGLGCIFGATEVVTVAFAEGQGAPGAAAILLALWAAGSLAAGVAVGSFGAMWRPLVMFRVATVCLWLSFVPLMLVDHIPSAAVVLLISGMAISPSLVSAMSLVERVVPPARLTEGIGWTTTGLTVGLAVGSALSGTVVDAFGPSMGYGVPLAAGALAALASLFARQHETHDT